MKNILDWLVFSYLQMLALCNLFQKYFVILAAFYHQQSKAEVFQFVDVQSWKFSDKDIEDFLTSVFYVLESKRMQMDADKSDRY